MTGTSEKLKGFGIGLSMAGIAVLSSGAQATQAFCSGACAGCYACGLAAAPLAVWFAVKRARKIGSNEARGKAGNTLDPRS
jgi:hypothetical protein